MILYNIQHFGNFRWIPWLLRMLQHPNNQFLITYDGAIEDVNGLRRVIEEQGIEAKRIIVVRSQEIHWCGPSQARNFLEAINLAAGLDGWEFFVNLSGACVPLRAQSFIFDVLNRHKEKGKTCHFSSFKVQDNAKLPSDDESGYRTYVEFGRLRRRGSRPLLDQFRDPAYFPVRNVQNRPFVQCTEPFPSQRVLYVSRPSSADMEFRKKFFAQYPHHAGRAWFVLHRTALDRLLAFSEKSISMPWREVFLCSFEPDESFIPTALMNFDVIDRDEFSGTNFRAFEGTPADISDKNMSKILDLDKSLFARKIWHNDAANLRSVIESRVLGQ